MHGCCYVRTSRRVSKFQLFVFIIFLFLVSGMFRLSALSATSGYNMLFASKLEPHQADILIGDRKPLDVILRLVEDVPEVILGVTDAILFGATWFTILSITLSFSMVVVALLLGSFQYLNASAAIVAKDLASAKDHAALPQRRSEAKPRETE